MSSLNNPKPWVPYMNTKDCSQGFCSLYCPQWCYIIFPPPPPVEFPEETSGSSFSPLVIAIIGILASAFLLVSYYAIISKYCGNMDSPRRRQGEDQDQNEDLEERDDPSIHELWQVPTNGLDEALIKSITVFKYKKGDGLIEGTDCSVCLSEFQENESLRLLPKCSHAFHVTCIDTWLKSHSNCPLCRANIIFITPSPVSEVPPLPVIEAIQSTEALPENDGIENVEDTESGVREEEVMHNNTVLKTQFRAMSDLGNPRGRDTIIEIREEDDQQIRRSASMDYLSQTRVSISDVLHMKQEEDFLGENHGMQGDAVAGSSKRPVQRSRILHFVTSPVAMKRSFSSGRFSVTKRWRGGNLMIPS
ncbi:hypothetical protein NMG60_11027556 [Bertholletia excelsa]